MSADPPAHAPLDELIREIGPMPGPVAAGYARQAAAALRGLHERGRCHGDVRSANMVVRPVLTRAGDDGSVQRRPAPGAEVVLADGPEPPADAAPAADLLGLGRVVYFLLVGRPPAASPAPLAVVRPDLPPGFAALVHRLLGDDPPTAADAEAELAAFAPAAAVVADPSPGWAADPTGPREPLPRRPRTAGEKARIGLLVGLGLVLNLAAVGLGVAWLTGALGTPKPEPTTEPTPAAATKKADRPVRTKKAAKPDPEPEPDEPLK